MNIPLQEVESSQIKAIGYDHGSKTLAIQFHGRGKDAQPSTYHYGGFNPLAWNEFKSAPSIGSHFYQKIKGKFPHTKQST